jgi:2-oxoglutarate ferredoxin oxidoreductase subunit alpha
VQSKRRLVKGNEAIALGAIAGGCDAFFGYPITPQNEVPEILSSEMPRHGRVFLQAESEVASINMVYGAAAAGKRAMTSSSSPGISLMMEGVSYLAGAELPCLIVNVMRGGPGLGSISPSQADYFQAVKGGGHGDYRCIVLAPWNVEEMYQFPELAFDMADRYRNPAIILADGVLGQMMEPAAVPDEMPAVAPPDKPWATMGRNGRSHKNVANSLVIDPYELRDHNRNLQSKYERMQPSANGYPPGGRRGHSRRRLRYLCPGCLHRVQTGPVARRQSRSVPPDHLVPLPDQAAGRDRSHGQERAGFELSSGQMVEDVRLALNGSLPVHFYGEMGGVIPSPAEVCDRIMEAVQ